MKEKRSSGSVTSLLLLEYLIESVSPPTAGRLALLAAVLLSGTPPGLDLEARPPGAGAGQGVGLREGDRDVGRAWRDTEGAGGAARGEDGSSSPQLPEAGALLQAASSYLQALVLQGVEPG